MPVRYQKNYDVIQTDDELGLVYGWAAVFTKNGEEYFDLQGDSIDPDAMEMAALDFAQNSRVAGDMHESECGTVPFVMPITKATREAFGMDTDITGLAIGMKPSAAVYEKFKSGEYTGFSIGGTRIEESVVEKLAKRHEKRKALRQGRRRRMTKFSMDEISAVDEGAQEPAKALLLKRKGDSDSGSEPDDSDLQKRAYLTTAVDRHAHLLEVDSEDGSGARASGFTSFEADHSHPWIMDDEGSLIIGVVNGHAHEAAEISTSRQEASMLIDRIKKGNPMPKTDLEKLNEMQAKFVRMEKVLELDDSARGYFKSLDTAGQDSFLAKSKDDRKQVVDAELAKRNDADPVIATLEDGTEIRKSADPMIVKLAQQQDESRKEIAKLRATHQNASLRKRATEELSNLPGTVEEKMDLIKAVDSLPEAAREGAMKTLTAGNEAIKGAFSKRGIGGASAAGNGAESFGFSKANSELDGLAKARQSEKSIDFQTAYQEVSNENPQLAEQALTETFDA